MNWHQTTDGLGLLEAVKTLGNGPEQKENGKKKERERQREKRVKK